MAKRLLDGLDIVAGADRCHRVAVPEIVESGVRAPNRLTDFFEMSPNGVWNQVPAQLVGEYQIHRIVKASLTHELIFKLLPFHPAKGCHHKRSRNHDAAFAVLRGNQVILAGALIALQLSPDCQAAGIDIHVIPCESKDLTLAHPGEQCDDEKILEPMSFDRLQEGRDLIIIQGMDLFSLHPWELAGDRRIGFEISIHDSLLQGLVKDAMIVFHRFGRQCLGLLIDEVLDHVRGQRFQTDGSKGRFQVILYNTFIVFLRSGFHAAEICLNPNIQPLAHRHLGWGYIGTSVDGGRGFPQLRRHLFLGLSGDGSLDLTAGGRIVAV